MTTAVILSKTQAAALTERIRRAGEDFGTLLLEAHDGEAWRVLGYATWQDYVAGEFTFTRARSYQLLNQAKVTRLVGAHVTDREVRHMSTMVDTPLAEAPSETVQRLLTEQRERSADPKPAMRRGGYVPPADRLRAAFRLIIDVNEQMEAEDSLPPDLERTAQNALLALRGMLHQ